MPGIFHFLPRGILRGKSVEFRPEVRIIRRMWTFLPSLLQGESGTLVLATVGGVVVFFGLVVERCAEWMDERFLSGYHAHKKLETAGWRILMLGIAVEVADGVWSAHDAWQTKQMANPLNANISDMSATVVFFVNRHNFTEVTNWNNEVSKVSVNGSTPVQNAYLS